MQELQERILLKGDELFRKYGIRSITMDDIAKQLGVSKKTLYQYYPEKETLVVEVTRMNIDQHVKEMDNCTGAMAKNAVEELLAVVASMAQMLQCYNPIMFYDLQKYHPKGWDLFRKYRNDNMLQKIKENMFRGIQEGLYRSDIDIEVLSRMRLEQVDMCFNFEIFPPTQFQFHKVASHVTEHFLY
ncbi:MAG: TetR/AcrR family transcriptional regulator, partial [Bacteroidia bacterium]|nr:TetR/AcrR family transcriptional regulator [Bacteroidia bacterium]